MNCSGLALTLAIALFACVRPGNAEVLRDLSSGQTGRIQFISSNPPHRWALIRNRLGPEQVVLGDLTLPAKSAQRFPAVIMSHGSDGITEGMREVWAKPLLAAGYAVFMVDSFTSRNGEKISGTAAQLTWDTTTNIADAVYALKLLSTHPRIDPERIFHLGWSRGAVAVTAAMWENYRLPITQSASIKWAGSIAVYPGCNIRYRNPTLKITAPVLYLLAEKDDMTPAQPCVEEAQILAAEGQPVTFKVYPDSYHVFDRPAQSRMTVREGTYAKCAIDVQMPSHAADRTWGPAFNRATRTVLSTPAEWEAAVQSCAGTFWITVVSNDAARERAVKDALDFLANASQQRPATAVTQDNASIERGAQEIMQRLNFK